MFFLIMLEMAKSMEGKSVEEVLMRFLKSLGVLWTSTTGDDWIKSISVVDKTFSTGNRLIDHVFHDVVNH